MRYYENADLYDAVEDTEELAHATPAEALASYVEMCVHPAEEMAAAILRRGPINIFAYKRMPVDDTWAAREAYRAAEMIAEDFDDEYMGDDHALGDEELKALEAALRTVITATFADVKPFQCEGCGDRTYSPEEVLALVKGEKPEWFA
jgi:hypothetical protein